MEIILSLSLLIFGIVILILLYSISNLKSELSTLKIDNTRLIDDMEIKDKTISKLRNPIELSIIPGQRAIISNYQLKSTSDNVSFAVTYEVDILDVTASKVKVKASNYTSNDSYAKNPNNRNSIISFMSEKWISRGEIELIISDSDRRGAKLDNLLGDL